MNAVLLTNNNPNDLTCGICYDSFDFGKEPWGHQIRGMDATQELVENRHPYHKQCFKNWVLIRSCCPGCEVAIDPDSLTSRTERVSAIASPALRNAGYAILFSVVTTVAFVIAERIGKLFVEALATIGFKEATERESLELGLVELSIEVVKALGIGFVASLVESGVVLRLGAIIVRGADFFLDRQHVATDDRGFICNGMHIGMQFALLIKMRLPGAFETAIMLFALISLCSGIAAGALTLQR